MVSIGIILQCDVASDTLAERQRVLPLPRKQSLQPDVGVGVNLVFLGGVSLPQVEGVLGEATATDVNVGLGLASHVAVALDAATRHLIVFLLVANTSLHFTMQDFLALSIFIYIRHIYI